ncbi:sensor domain-containing diguanylate cyclase [Methylophaga sp. OBS3]|uniref:sensor domain-containing diguanylate cyclase n=1 Tax=Methylophaga sp. OBS3 TaxID=2991934 RepID=UPI0022568F25|nr:sensor domain-containing diguanylate cyclase [Methylophaga sp. OBS3]MCX4190835.1 diguanylate cyclase [Methylophaga sp. OBS3]
MSANLPNFDQLAIEALLEVVSDGIWFWHADTGYVYRSPGWYTMLGYNPHSLDNTVFTWESVIHTDDYPKVMKHFEQYIAGSIDAYLIEYRCRTKRNDFIWIRDQALIIDRAEDGSVSRMIGAHHDIDAEKSLDQVDKYQSQNLQNIIDERTAELYRINKLLTQKAAEAERNATTDYLTSLSNRFNFEKCLETEIARAKRFQEAIALIVFDLDNFKQINDRHGHPTGDEVLISVGKVLHASVREIDVASRWGGDEFALLLPNTSLDQAMAVAEKLRVSITEVMQQLDLNSSASFGVVELLKDESKLDFLRRADNALYQSKNAGRNTVSTHV